ncbi:MAG: DnaD domain protein [Thermomicrobiaceae bacterium]
MTANDPNQTFPVPAWFLEQVAPRIREMVELQVMLGVFRLLQGSSKFDRPISETRLLQDSVLLEALRLEGAVRPPEDAILRGIELSVARESLLRFTVSSEDEGATGWLLLATPDNRVTLEKYRTGALEPPVAHENATTGTVERTRPGVFQLYEQNIGLVTPIIADRLVEALELYPQSWIEDAIAAAVSYNRRNWRYIQRILETWATEGRSNETNKRHQPGSGEFDPEKHLTGEYAAIFRRRRRE